MSAWLLALTLLAADLPADLERRLLTAPSARDLPDANAVYLLHERVFEASETGRIEVRLRATIKLLREAGRDFQVVWLPWLTPYQTVSVVAARVVWPDLRVTDVRETALEQVLPATGGARRWRLRFPSLEAGAVIDYEVHVADTRPSMPEGFADQFQLQLAEPVVEARYTLRTPARQPFGQWVHGRLGPETVTRRGPWHETTWRATDLPGLATEPQRPEDMRLALWLLVAAPQRWEEVAARYRRAAAPAYVATPALRAEVERLAGEEDPVGALAAFVAGRIRYGAGDLERGLPGLEPRPAYETWRLRAGDCKDQATLLITLLREAGVTAWPALLRRRGGGPLVSELPCLLQFDHVIVAVPRAGGYRWLDPTFSRGPVDYLPGDIRGVPALIVRDDGSEWATLPTLPAEANRLTRTGELEVAADGGLTGRVTVTASGGFEQSLRYRLAGQPPVVVARDVAESLNQALPGARLDEPSVNLSDVLDPRRSFALSYGFTVAGYAQRTRRLLLLRPAVFERAELPAGLVNPRRRYPLRLASAPEQTLNELTFRLPPGLTVLEAPEDTERSEPFATYRLRYRLAGGILSYRREVTWREVELAPELAPAARRWFDALRAADEQVLVLTTGG